MHFCFGEEFVVLGLEEMAIKAVPNIIGSRSDEWAAVLIGRSFDQVGSCGEGLDYVVFMWCDVKVLCCWKPFVFTLKSFCKLVESGFDLFVGCKGRPCCRFDVEFWFVVGLGDG